MRLLVTGIEYAGKRTLGIEISRWWAGQTGDEFLEPPHLSFHDHFTLPHVVHAMGHEDHKAQTEKDLLNASAGLQQLMQLYNFSNKFGRGYTDMPDLFLIDWYYSDAVYAPLYYGFGGPGQYAERRLIARSFDAEAMSLMPDMVLVLMKASPETIRQRVVKGESPFPGRHADTYFDPKDTETVLEAFQEQFQLSLFKKKFVLDTTNASVEESLEEFKQQIQPHITPTDRLRVLTHRALSEG
jgi:hypothetical protein